MNKGTPVERIAPAIAPDLAVARPSASRLAETVKIFNYFQG